MNTLHKILDLIWAAGLEEREFCEKAGISKTAVTEWKKGKTKSYLKHIDKIADVLNVTVDYLLDNKKPPAKAEGTEDDEDIKAFANLLSDLTDEELAQVAEFVALLKQKRNS